MPVDIPQRFSRLAFVLAVVITSACATPGGSRLEMSSLASDYAPAGRFWLRIHVRADSVIVAIDSAILLVPGPAMHASPPALSDVRLRALVVTDDTTSRRSLSATDRAWRPLEVSDQVHVADTLRYGRPERVGRVTLSVPITERVEPTADWLVLQFTAGALRSDGKPRVETFVCSPVNLRGASPSAASRARRLQSSYMAAC